MASVDDVKLRKCSAGQHAESRTRADSTVLFDIQTGANIRPGQADQVPGRGTADQGPLVFLARGVLRLGSPWPVRRRRAV